MSYFSVNGEKQNSISMSDRSIAYGEGIFTTAKIVNGKIEFLSAHMSRLIEGCQYLDIPFTHHEVLLNEINQVALNYPLAVLKIVVTAGSGGRGYSKNGVTNPQTLVSIHEYPAHYQQWSKQGITIAEGKIQLGLNPIMLGLKHLNRLEQVMIRRELDASPVDDFIVTDLNDYIVESSCANLFWFDHQQLFTPIINEAGIKGIYREKLLSFDNTIIPVKHKLSDLANVTAMFVCNSVMGIVPVKQYNDKLLDIAPVIAFNKRFIDAYNA
ncbi:aminodeoxychorismate lyase [Colwelliaceae bacterium 6441]